MEQYGSYPISLALKPFFRISPMRLAIFPIPTSPTALPVSSIPVISGGAMHENPSPLLFLSHTDMFLLISSIRPTINSATEFVLAKGVLITGTPNSFAAARSMVLHPTPCFPITFRFTARDMISRPIFTARNMIPSISCMRSKLAVISARCLIKRTASGWMYSLK